MSSYYNIKIFFFLIRISFLIGIILNNVYYFINFDSSYITLKIKGPGKKYIYRSEGSFAKENRPNIVKKDDIVINPQEGVYNFDNGINRVILEWTKVLIDCSHIFHGCPDITEIDLSHFQTSKVIKMGSMFRECYSLTSIKFGNFDTTKVEDMGFMFELCGKLTSIDLSSFDTSRVTLMWNMFSGCSSLSSLNLLTFNTFLVTDISDMFSNCKSLTSLNLNKFFIPSVLNMKNTFSNCSKLQYINMFNFKENKLNSATKMFSSVPYNIVICINKKNINKKILLELESIKCYTIIEDCSINWKSKQKKLIGNKCVEIEEKKNTELVKVSEKPTSIEIPKNLFNKYNITDILREINKKNKSEDSNEYYDFILEIIENFFSLKVYDTSNIDKGEEEQISIGKIQVTLTTSKNQKNNIYNGTYITNNTLIDLTKCEISLRAFYNISNDTSLYIQKIDVTQEGMQIPKVEYDVYSRLGGNKLQKLNLSICQNNKINIYTNIDSISNLDIINPTSGYYTDVCYPTTSDVGIDIILNDRKKEFVEKNKTVCQEDCNFIGYNYKTKKANCSCDVKEASLFFKNIIINRNKLYQNFLEINSIANIDFLFCYKMLFTKKGLLKNIGSYILLLIILFHIICIIIFYIKSFPKLKHQINYIFKCKINLSTIGGNEVTKNKSLKYKKIFIQNKNKKININKKFLIKYKRLKRRKKYSKKHIKTNNNKNMDNCNKKIIKQNKFLNFFRYTDDEINDLSYELAIKSDKRSFFEYYISLLKTKHDIFFSFCYNKDYNARILKIDLFFLGFTMSYVINGLFFTDETMHKIYEDKGSFDFIYQFPKTIYSTIISLVLDYIIKLLALSNDVILDFKNIKLTKDYKKIKKYLIIKLRIKFLLYFIISSILLILFWYYIGMFCVIYNNTQIHLIQDTIFSFIESSIYPIWINLFPGIFRIPALSNQKNKRIYLYKFSQFLQIL